MKILIDGDGCPVIKQALAIAGEYDWEVLIFCDNSHILTYPDCQIIVVEKGRDNVDFILMNHACSGDIVITQDYGLAALALGRKAYAINQNGYLYKDDNIDALLFSRHMGQKIRRSGKHLKGPAKRNAQNDRDFSE
ncbi:MAG: DUF188 domain-containing protein, partial [Clostridiales bacterium]